MFENSINREKATGLPDSAESLAFRLYYGQRTLNKRTACAMFPSLTVKRWYIPAGMTSKSPGDTARRIHASVEASVRWGVNYSMSMSSA